jgi:hypothetical protein
LSSLPLEPAYKDADAEEHNRGQQSDRNPRPYDRLRLRPIDRIHDGSRLGARSFDISVETPAHGIRCGFELRTHSRFNLSWYCALQTSTDLLNLLEQLIGNLLEHNCVSFQRHEQRVALFEQHALSPRNIGNDLTSVNPGQ